MDRYILKFDFPHCTCHISVNDKMRYKCWRGGSVFHTCDDLDESKIKTFERVKDEINEKINHHKDELIKFRDLDDKLNSKIDLYDFIVQL